MMLRMHQVFNRVGVLVVGLGLVALALGACSRASYPQRVGAYPLDIFYEMHYSPSWRTQQPDRLAPPLGAVPVQGAEVRYSIEQSKPLVMPATVLHDPQALEKGQALFQVSCSQCHGPLAKGDGRVQPFLKAVYGSPPNLTAPTTVGRTDGEIFGIITNGIYVMPIFRNLLTEEQRWQVVRYLRTLQGQ